MKIKSCEFNLDTACIEIVYADGKMLSMYIPNIENSLRTTHYSQSKLDKMLYDEPLEYAKMIMGGSMQAYLDRVDGIGRERLKDYTDKLSSQFSKGVAEDIAREMLMYE